MYSPGPLCCRQALEQLWEGDTCQTSGFMLSQCQGEGRPLQSLSP
uniref:Uncharacterized protein n=1 Tax=Trichinella nativa TaxID=6335 RepID=A0A0V1KGY2_9BILA